MKQKTEDRRQKMDRLRRGSAIILAVVLASLLAIIGVLFLFSSRVDSVATSAVGENHDLNLAVDTVVAQISQVLTRNVPGVNPNIAYYNYPDAGNPWLACLEPYQFGTDYFWRQVSNIYGSSTMQNQNVQAQILPDYNNIFVPYTEADADGDGVSDSIWVQVSDVNSSKGKPVYAAIRIIDNGGMLNVNTAYRFDPSTSVGSTQLDINLMALAALDHTHMPPWQLTDTRQDRLLSYRCGSGPTDINLILYTNNVIWQYGLPNGAYTPFDISDELVLRYRYILNNDNLTTRIENLWTNAFKGGLEVPRDTSIIGNNWAWVVNNNYPAPCGDPCIYDNRHIATTYNMDRIIDPNGNKMFNINYADANNIIALRNKIRTAIGPNIYLDANQIAVNLIDYIDNDSNVAYFVDPGTLKQYFGFETPCIYISQIAHNFFKDTKTAAPAIIEGKSYAIELYKPYASDVFPDLNNRWRLVINRSTPIYIPVVWSGNSPFFVIKDINAFAPLDINNVTAGDANSFGMVFDEGDRIRLEREVNENGLLKFEPFDWVDIPLHDPVTGWLIESVDSPLAPRSIKRDISLHKCIRRLWEPLSSGSLLPPALGGFDNRYVSLDAKTIQAHPANKPFTNVGEIGQLFRTDAYLIDSTSTEPDVRLNLADPCVQNLFNYLTVIDPYDHYQPFPETKIKGRININTAPWYVLAQLPWVTNPDDSLPYVNRVQLAQAIVNDRDTYGAFKSTGEIMRVGGMGYYQGKAIPTGLLTPTDCNGDAFEERDVIFDRISNLITVRSDVFTAYILIRIGPNGPQKRVIAIFDRSGVTPTSGKVKIVAIQSVPDPR
jgi:hypothetical protein